MPGGHQLAVAVGFEPTVGLTPHNISSVAPSAARTRHRAEGYRRRPAGRNPAVPSPAPPLVTRCPRTWCGVTPPHQVRGHRVTWRRSRALPARDRQRLLALLTRLTDQGS